MANKRTRAPSRPREEWIELVKAWKDSGLSAAEFAHEHGLKAKALSTWRWRLRKQPTGPSGAAAPRLVQVSVADLMGAGDTSTGRWELTTIEGHRLRVQAPVAGAELEVLLRALVRGRGRR
jgi:transposase-like protein